MKTHLDSPARPARTTAKDSARATLQARYASVRLASQALARPLSAEDQCAQSMPDASPVKWHLAHTSWFFESVVLGPYQPGYRPFDAHYNQLFNSYYESLGPRIARHQRGLLTRPGLDEVQRYRKHVDAAIEALVQRLDDTAWASVAPLVELGLNHEQQHQELMLTDVKHLLSLNPLQPAYVHGDTAVMSSSSTNPLTWWDGPSGLVDIGHPDHHGFAFDNEGPRHAVLVHPYQLATRPVSCGDYLAFIRDGGYRRPAFWLSDGWALVQSQSWNAPLYWSDVEADRPTVFTLMGPQAMNPAEPVCHLSLYEAAAYAEWAAAQWPGARLPTEFEWEAAARAAEPLPAPRYDRLFPHPRPAPEPAASGLSQMLGEVWEWTRSSYDPYPGFKPLPGVASEYNGKFMVGQMVLRGGSCATPAGHLRTSYRNFFPSSARWQFSGLRLARDSA